MTEHYAGFRRLLGALRSVSTIAIAMTEKTIEKTSQRKRPSPLTRAKLSFCHEKT
jgi:hypothetical protein